VDSRAEALRRLKLAGKTSLKDDDGGMLADDPVEVFCNLPPLPPRWDDTKGPLHFKMPRPERVFLRDKLIDLWKQNAQSGVRGCSSELFGNALASLKEFIPTTM